VTEASWLLVLIVVVSKIVGVESDTAAQRRRTGLRRAVGTVAEIESVGLRAHTVIMT
jgi:hypothetical protein